MFAKSGVQRVGALWKCAGAYLTGLCLSCACVCFHTRRYAGRAENVACEHYVYRTLAGDYIAAVTVVAKTAMSDGACAQGGRFGKGKDARRMQTTNMCANHSIHQPEAAQVDVGTPVLSNRPPSLTKMCVLTSCLHTTPPSLPLLRTPTNRH